MRRFDRAGPDRLEQPAEEEMAMGKVLYKPLSIGFSVIGGVVASALFKRLWKLASGKPDAPEATSSEHGWGEVLAAAALQGAIFGLVKAAVDRGGAVGVRKLTGFWPGE
jgi:hypothetical protein